VPGRRILPLLDTPFFFIRLCHQRGEKAWRRPFQSPRCTIHGSGEERDGAFMNFTSPARQNSIKTPEDDLLDILVAIRLYLLFLDDTDIPLRRLPLADSSRQKA